MKKQINFKKNKFQSLTAILALLLLTSFSLKAQEAKTTSGEKQIKIVLDVNQLKTDQDAAKIKDMLNSYPGKILNFSIDKSSKKVTVFISENLQIIDLLEVFDIIGFRVGYLNENNEYVKLDANGHLSKQPYGFKKQ